GESTTEKPHDRQDCRTSPERLATDPEPGPGGGMRGAGLRSAGDGPGLPIAARAGDRLTPVAPVRPWHAVWPEHVPMSLAYPAAPAWWFLERNLPRFAGRVAVRELDFQTLAERRVLTYEALFRAARGVATGLRARGVGPGLRVALCVANGA